MITLIQQLIKDETDYLQRLANGYSSYGGNGACENDCPFSKLLQFGLVSSEETGPGGMYSYHRITDKGKSLLEYMKIISENNLKPETPPSNAGE